MSEMEIKMQKHRKVTQVTKATSIWGEKTLALCEDGSLWEWTGLGFEPWTNCSIPDDEVNAVGETINIQVPEGMDKEEILRKVLAEWRKVAKEVEE